MRHVETHTKKWNSRMTANSKRKLRQKVASSKHSQHRGYPSSGYFSYFVVDPTHNTFDTEQNICYSNDPKKTAVFTAALGFPHISIEIDVRRDASIQNLIPSYNVNEILYDVDDSQVEEVLYERERLRMKAVKDSHPYALDESTNLTIDPDEKVLINAKRAAERRNNEVTVEDVKEVLNYERNNQSDILSFPVEDLTEEMLLEMTEGKTCAPPIPNSDVHVSALLYWIDNPDATIKETIEGINANRGTFETFRLIRVDSDCYDDSYIESLSFDMDSFSESLKQWISNTNHEVLSCTECDFWTCSGTRGLLRHLHTHENVEVEITEENYHTTQENTDSPHSSDLQVDENVEIDELMDNFTPARNKTEISDVDSILPFFESLGKEEAISRLAESLDKSERREVLRAYE